MQLLGSAIAVCSVPIPHLLNLFWFWLMVKGCVKTTKGLLADFGIIKGS